MERSRRERREEIALMNQMLLKNDKSLLTDRVIAAIAHMQKKPPESITLDSKFEELGIDSLSSFDLLCELEDELGIVIPDDDARQIATVRDVIDRVGTLLATASA
jgi:acyl carrier protein